MDSTELIALWHEKKEILKEKDFRGDQWRLAYNAFLMGFSCGYCDCLEKVMILDNENTGTDTDR